MSISMSELITMLVHMQAIEMRLDDEKSDIKNEILEYKKYWFYPFCVFALITACCKILALDLNKRASLLEKKKPNSLKLKLSIVSFFLSTAIKLYKLKDKSKLHELVFRRWLSIQYLDGRLDCILHLITEQQIELLPQGPLKRLARTIALKRSNNYVNIANLIKPLNYVEAFFATGAPEASRHSQPFLFNLNNEIDKLNDTQWSIHSLPHQFSFSDGLNVLVVFNSSEPDEKKICRRLTTLLKIRYPNLRLGLLENGMSLSQDFTEPSKKNLDPAMVNFTEYDMVFFRDVCVDVRISENALNFVYFYDDQSRMRNTFELMGLRHFKLNINTLKKRLLRSSDFVLYGAND